MSLSRACGRWQIENFWLVGVRYPFEMFCENEIMRLWKFKQRGPLLLYLFFLEMIPRTNGEGMAWSVWEGRQVMRHQRWCTAGS
jgi:hypothetical protein